MMKDESKGKTKKRRRGIEFLKKGKNITALSVAVFAGAVLMTLLSTFYMNYCIENERKASESCETYEALGDDLANASDYLTNEARLFAVTHNVEHFYNYWKEIYDTKTRENAIEEFESSSLPQSETDLLVQAKQHSDELVDIETRSMKMVFLSDGITEKSYPDDKKLQGYVRNVLSYELPEKYASLTSEEYKDKAVTILYNLIYDGYKNEIMTPIDEFREHIAARLEGVLADAESGTAAATALLVASSVITLAAIGALLYMINRLYVMPIRNYTRRVRSAGALNGSEPTVALKPEGAYEVERLGEVFNTLTGDMFDELNYSIESEKLMRRAKNEAEFANRLKSMFFANMSHELRTPLNAVNGYSELLLETELSDRQKNYVRGIRYSSDGLLGLINDILDFSKLEAGELEIERKSFELKKLFNEVKSVVGMLAEKKGLKLVTAIDEKIPETLVGDPMRLKQVLVNLAGNAVKFTREGGVEITALAVKRNDESCTVKFCVADTGIGIAEDKIEYIFKPYTQGEVSTTRNFGGTGLGLSICSQIVSACSGGKIEVESKPGKGSRFMFELEFGIDEIETETDGCHRTSFDGNTVLVVDDNEINLSIECEMLRLCGFNALSAPDAKSALKILNEHKETQLVFMDLRMPEVDGCECARMIRQTPELKDIPIVALSADVLPETKRRAENAGMNGYIHKPFSKRELCAVLSRFIKPAPEEASPLSLEELRAKVGGNDEVVKSSLNIFIGEYGGFCKKLDDLKAENNPDEAYELVHKLKGASGIMGLALLHGQCDMLCTALKNGKFDGLEEFKLEFEKTYNAVAAYRNRNYGGDGNV